MRVVLLYTLLAATLALAQPVEDGASLAIRDDADLVPEGGFTVTYVDEDAAHSAAVANTGNKRDLGAGGDDQLAKRPIAVASGPVGFASVGSATRGAAEAAEVDAYSTV